MTGLSSLIIRLARALSVAICAFLGPGLAQSQVQHVTDPLDKLLQADWIETDWVSTLLKHVDENLDAALPLGAPDGWRAALRQAVYDCWDRDYVAEGSLPLRSYDECSDQNEELSTRMHDVAWVLVRHEWAGYQGTLDASERRAAAWHLDQAISEYKALVSGAEARSIEPQSTSVKRLLTIRGFEEEIAADLGVGNASGLVRRQQVRDEINRQLALDGSGAGDLKDVFQAVVGPIQALTRDAMITYLSAVEAELNARALAVLVYGDGGQDATRRGSKFSAYLNCRKDGTEGGCDPDSERTVLSLSELAKSSDLRSLYNFVRDAVLERPNAVGLSVRYARMKKALLDDPVEAAKAYAELVELGWFDNSGSNTFQLHALMYGNEVLKVPQDDGGAPKLDSMEEACRFWAKKIDTSGGLCPFRALAARALPIDGAPDVFALQERERMILSLLAKVQKTVGNPELTKTNAKDPIEAEKNATNPKLAALIAKLLAETGAVLSDDRETVERVDVALPYLEDPKPTGQNEVAEAFCSANPADLFQANRCRLKAPDEEGGVLQGRLARLIVGETPLSGFEAKRLGLFAVLEEIDQKHGTDLIQDGLLQRPERDTPRGEGDDSFVELLCLHGPTILEALRDAGLRDVQLSAARPGFLSGGICQ